MDVPNQDQSGSKQTESLSAAAVSRSNGFELADGSTVRVEVAAVASITQSVRPPNSRRWEPSAFWFSFWLAVVFVATKAVHFGVPFSYGVQEYLNDIVIVSYADVLFVLGVGAVAQVALWLTASRPLLLRLVWVALGLFCLVSVVFAIVSVQIFAYLRSPLTYPLIYLAGDVKNMQSSVGAFVSRPLLIAIVATPIVYLIASCITHRFIQPRRSASFRLMQLVCLAAIAAAAVYGRQMVTGEWGDRDDRLIAENPHWYLASSVVTELLGGQSIRLVEDFPDEDLDDFLVVGERTAPAVSLIAADKRPKNVIVVVMESTATRYLSLYGSSFATTPNLQREAAHAVVFENAYCHVGLTANALVAIALSNYPGMTYKEYTVEHPALPGTTLAQVLKTCGYRTAFVHSGDLEYTNQIGFLQNRGFDDLWDYRQLGCGLPNFGEFSWGVEDRCMVEGILKWIDQDRSKPFCVLSWTIQAHHPYMLQPPQPIDFFNGEPPPGAEPYTLNLYLNVQREVDAQLGRLFDGLRERGLADDTVVVIVGDHGEAFGEPHKTYGHGSKLFEECVNVPMIVWSPRLFPEGRRETTVGSQIDINPTVTDLLGVPPADSWQGRSLFDATRPPRAYFYASNDDYLLGVRECRWKYTYNATRGRDVLFDLENDPTEQTNVADQHADVCRRLRQRLAAWMAYEREHLAELHAAEGK